MNKASKIILIISILAFLISGIAIIVVALNMVNKKLDEDIAVILGWVFFGLSILSIIGLISGVILLYKANKDKIKEYYKKIR